MQRSRKLFGSKKSIGLPTIGEEFDNRYLLERHLGSGGGSSVFRALDTRLSRQVAIKILSATEIDAEGIARLRREAVTIARLNHPGIVTLYDFETAEGNIPYLVLEFIDGDDLWALLYDQHRVFTPHESIKLCLKILDALDYAHQQGVIHRDLKPENVMITDVHLTPKVMDFGLASIRGQKRITQEGVIAGSAYYISPEVALGKLTDHRVDLYALGVMLYELVTGRLPFYAENPLVVISQHAHDAPIPPRHIQPAISPTLEAIILKLLSKNPDERFSSARTTIEALLSLDTQPLSIEKAPTDALLERIERTRLIGREAEWNRLRESWQKVQVGSVDARPIVLLTGEAGTGKNELAQQLAFEARHAGARVIGTLCYPNLAAQPYQPVLDILRDSLRHYPRLLTPRLASDLSKLLPEIALEHPIEPLPSLSAEGERLRLYEHVAEFLIQIAQVQPLVILIEYLHCADASSLAMLQHIGRKIKETHILLVCTYRPSELDHRHPLVGLVREWTSQDLAEQITLRRLTQEEVNYLVKAIFEDPIHPKLGETIFEKSQGNIFFTRELLKSLIDGNYVRWDAGHKRWQVESLHELELPTSIRSIISQNLSRLSERTIEILSNAAVIGSEFRFRILAAISEIDEESLSTALEEALKAQVLVEKKGNRDETYTFINTATHQTLLETLNQRRQARLHLKIAQALEKLYPNQLDQNIERIARHYSVGARTDDDILTAIDYLEKAADRASHIFALQNALELYTLALELAQEDSSHQHQERLISLRERRGMVYQQTGEFAAAAQDLEAILQLVASDPLHKRAVLLQLGQVYRRSEHFETSIQNLSDAVAISRSMGDERLVADALYFLGATYWSLGKITQAMAHQQEGYQIVQRLGLHDEVAMRVLHGVAECYGRQVDYEKLYQLAQESIALGRELGDLEYQAENWNIIATAEVDQGYFERAQATCETASRVCEAASLRWHWTANQAMDGMAKAAGGDYQAGLTLLREASDIALKEYWGFLQTLTLTMLGRCYLQLEALPEAEKTLTQALECGQRHRIFWSNAAVNGYWALAQIRQGNLAVGSLLETALEQALADQDMRHVPILYAALAELELARKSPQTAHKFAQNMALLAEQIDQPIQVIEAKRLQANALLELGEVNNAQTILEQALEESASVRYPRLIWKLHEVLAEVYSRQQKAEAANKARRRARGIVEEMIADLDDLTLKRQLGVHLPRLIETQTLTTTLRLLVVTDSYGSLVRNAIEEHLADVLRCDALIVLGDVPQQTYPSLRQDFAFKMPGFCVFGNHDNQAWEEWLPRYKFDHLHLAIAGFKIGGREITFGGFSGSEQYRASDQYNNAEVNLLQWEDRVAARHMRDLPYCDILLTHTAGTPPPNYPADRNHRGLKAIHDYIAREQPKLSLHGHFHHNYQNRQGHTQIIGCYGAVLIQCMITADNQWHFEVQPLMKD